MDLRPRFRDVAPFQTTKRLRFEGILEALAVRSKQSISCRCRDKSKKIVDSLMLF